MMLGPNKEILEAFLPSIREYCNGNITEDKYFNLLDEIRELEELITEYDNRYITVYDQSLPLFFMIKNNAIEVIIEKIDLDITILNKKRLDGSS